MKRGYRHQAPGQVVDTSEWEEEDLSYQEGTREKSTVFSPSSPVFPFLVPDHRYLSKKSNKRAPVQFWMEVVAYRLGCLCGVPVPPAFVSVNRKGECRALIEWFYKDWESDQEDVSYQNGYSIMREVDELLDKTKGKRHTLSTMKKALERADDASLENGEELLHSMFGIFVFDALIANTDRHHENWGIIRRWSVESGRTVVELSPAFDNGTSLGYNYPEEKAARVLDDPNWFSSFAARGTHHLRKEPDGEQYGHDELIRVLINENPDLRRIAEDVLSSTWTDFATCSKT